LRRIFISFGVLHEDFLATFALERCQHAQKDLDRHPRRYSSEAGHDLELRRGRINNVLPIFAIFPAASVLGGYRLHGSDARNMMQAIHLGIGWENDPDGKC
jgi:hypothetical protein